MSTAIPISQSEYEDLKKRVRILEDKIDELTHVAENEEEPVYGSDAWWEKSDKEALESLEKGDYYQINSKEELDDFFSNVMNDKSNAKYDNSVQQKSRKKTS